MQIRSDTIVHPVTHFRVSYIVSLGLVYFNDVPVGTICCRVEKGDHEGEGKLYLMTMGILAVIVIHPILSFPGVAHCRDIISLIAQESSEPKLSKKF